MTRSARLGLALVLAVLGLPALASAQVASRPDTHTVRPGDTLWDLARTYLGDPTSGPRSTASIPPSSRIRTGSIPARSCAWLAGPR